VSKIVPLTLLETKPGRTGELVIDRVPDGVLFDVCSRDDSFTKPMAIQSEYKFKLTIDELHLLHKQIGRVLSGR